MNTKSGCTIEDAGNYTGGICVFGAGGYPGGKVAPGKGGGFKGTPGDGKKMPGNVLKELSGLCNSPSSVLAGTESRTNFLFLREECENL